MKPQYTDTGFILRSVDSGEADKMVSVLSENHGLSIYIARGVRRLSSKKSSHLDLCNLVKFNVGRGDVPQFMNQVETIKYYPGIKSSFPKISLCLTIAEILTNTLPVDVEDREIFLSLKIFFDNLETAKDQKEINILGRRFALFILRHLGFPSPKNPDKDNLSVYFEAIMNRKIISKEIR